MTPTWEITYDAEADALYIGLMTNWTARSKNVRTIQNTDGLLFDIYDGKVVGIEVLGASRHPLFALVPKVSGDGVVLKEYRYATSP